MSPLMRRSVLCTLAIGVGCLTALRGAEIDGLIVVKHKLTRRKITLPSGPYDRGITVQVGGETADDPLTYERKHVVIYLEGDLGGAKSGQPAPIMEQKNRRFVPDLLVISAGTTVSFPNLDPIFHNVFSLSKPKSFDLGNYPAGHTRTVAFANSGVVLVNCHLHTNMTAAIVVTPNRWSAIADGEGHFALHGVPQGVHTIVAWHKAAGFFHQIVKTVDGQSAHVEFMIPLDEQGAGTLAQR
jgi:plastocyanin